MDTLTKIKRQLNIDQTNLSTATVISTSNATAKVRLPDGTTRTAYMADTVNAGDLVQVAIDGNLCSISGAAPMQARAAEKTVILT